jgi:predicted RNase H-like nuclease (RuvC/YqgF family)
MTFKETISLVFAELSPRRRVLLVLGVVGVILGCICLGSVWSHFSIRALEHDVKMAREKAANKQAIADAKEKEAEKYRLEAERLEGTLAEIQKLATKQDEELEKISKTTNDARSDAARARSVRAIDSTSAELCRRLEELGHGCGETQ